MILLNQNSYTMKTIHDLLTEITKLTYNIETNYPELYQYLDEQPITIPSDKNPEIDKEALQEYLEGLKKTLKHYIENHEKKANT